MGQRCIAALSIADGDDGLAFHQGGGVTYRGDGQPAGTDQSQHRDVASAVVADELSGKRAADDADGDAVRAGHDVEVGQHLTARVEHDAGAAADRVLIVDFGVDACHRRFDLARSSGRVSGSGRGRCRIHGRDQRQDRDKRGQQRR